MFDWNSLTPYIGVALGWLLNELSHFFRTRREDRRAIGRALAELLEIRHSFFGMKRFLRQYFEKLGAPKDIQQMLPPLIEGILPNLDSIHKRYGEAVDNISAFDPLLGFELRSKDSIRPLLSQAKSLMPLDPNGLAVWPDFERKLIDLVEPQFNEVILLVAREKSWVTWFKVRRMLKRPTELPTELDQFIKEIASIPGMPEIPKADSGGSST